MKAFTAIILCIFFGTISAIFGWCLSMEPFAAATCSSVIVMGACIIYTINKNKPKE